MSARPRLRWCLLVLLATLALAAPAGAQTVVSLTFDDSTADQYQVAPLLAAHGMHGTFYVITGALGESTHLSVPQLQALQAAGHEIAGHTVTHPPLSTLSPTEQAREICGSRNTLLAAGLRVTSFAYPYSDFDGATAQIARSCGYNSGRAVGGVISPQSCFDCPPVERLPPANPFDIQTPVAIGGTTTLDQLQKLVTQAEAAGGGWVPLVFHEVCEGCDPDFSISYPLLAAFVDWLAPRAAQGTVVRTVDQVVGGALAPAVPAPPIPPAPAPGSNLLQNPSLESASASGMPTCWQAGGFGTNARTWSRVATARSGGAAERLDLTNHLSGNVTFTSLQDLGDCAPAAAPGHTYRVSAWYTASAAPSFVSYYLTPSLQWRFWAQSPPLMPSGDWTDGTWYTPPAPPDAVALSVGMALDAAGTLVVDDLALVDAPPAPSPRPPPPRGTNMLRNPSLETVVGGVPSCWQRGGYGANSPVWGLGGGHLGSTSQRVDVTGLVSGNVAFVSQQDLGTCAPPATPGHAYQLSTWYRGTARPVLLAYLMGADGTWRFWAQGPPLPRAATWTQAAWTTPQVPADAVEISVGVALPSNGSLSVDDLALIDVPALSRLRVQGARRSAGARCESRRLPARRRTRGCPRLRATLLSFDLNAPATVRLGVAQSAGRRGLGRALASVVVRGRAGRNQLPLPRRLRNALARPGAYWVTARVQGQGAASARARVVVPRGAVGEPRRRAERR